MLLAAYGIALATHAFGKSNTKRFPSLVGAICSLLMRQAHTIRRDAQPHEGVRPRHCARVRRPRRADRIGSKKKTHTRCCSQSFGLYSQRANRPAEASSVISVVGGAPRARGGQILARSSSAPARMELGTRVGGRCAGGCDHGRVRGNGVGTGEGTLSGPPELVCLPNWTGQCEIGPDDDAGAT
jgi:hypothetical protein